MARPQPETGEAGAPAYSQQPLDEDAVLAEYNSRFRHARAHWDEWRTEARNLYDLVAGRQWDPVDEARLKDELRPVVTFNVSGKYMDVVTGLQINNRQDIRFYPREQGDAKLNELMTGAVAWGRDLCNALDDETDAFYDAALTGLGWMEGYLDKDLEPGGVPAAQRVDNLEMFPDPAARKRNLEDARYVIRIRFVDHDEYEELMGEAYEQEGSGDAMTDVEIDDEAVELIEEPQDYDKTPGSSSAAQKKRKCAIADYQFWRRETRWVATAPGYGRTELTQEQYQAYLPFLQAAQARGAPMQVQQVRRKVYYRAFIAKGKVGNFGLSPYQGGFTYHAITGKRDRNKATWYGIGRALMDPQRWLNKFFSSILYSIMTNSKGGLLAEEGTFKDSRKAESEWAKPGSITWLKQGALSNQVGKPKVIPKPESPYPQGMDRLMEFTLSLMPQALGMNAELMGLQDKVQPGVVEAQRKQSAMAIIAWAFDAMRRYYRSMGKQMARYVVQYVPEGTLIRVNGESSQQYVPLIKQAVGMDFDIVVDEAPTSVNQQERVWLALEMLIPQLLQAGVPITPKVLDYAPLPQDLIDDWKKLLSGDPQKQQFDMQAMMAELRKTISEAMKNETQAQLNQAKAQEASASSQLKGVQAIEHAAHAGAAQAQNDSRPQPG